MIDIIGNILEFFSLVLISASLLDIKIKKSKYTLLVFVYLLPDIIINIFSLNLSPDIDFLICLSILVLYLKLLFKIDIVIALCVHASTYIVMALIQLVFIIINTLILHLDPETTLTLFGALYSLILSILIYHYINLNKFFKFLFENGKSGKFIITNLFIVAAIAVFYFHVNLTTYYEIILYIIIAFAIIIICNLLLSNQLGKIKEQELRLNAYAEYLPVLEDLIHTVRVRQHNHNNQMQAIRGLLYTHKDYTTLSDALEEQLLLDKKYDIPEYLLKINLPLVAGFLYQKTNEAKKLGKHLDIEFSTFTLCSLVPEYDLIEMFGILIDNAIEAIPDNATVHVNVDCDGKRITFKTQNAGYILTPTDRKNFFTKGYSKKNDNKPHSGLGLYQLNELIKQYPASDLSLWNEGTDILFQIIV